jgi:hypothetical protein
VGLLLAAVAGLLAGTAALAAAAPDVARGAYYGGVQLGAVHLLSLGFLTVAIVGALLQLVPVLLRTPLSSPLRGALAGGGVAAGGWLLSAGLWADATVPTAAGGTLLVLAGAVVVVDLGLAVGRAARAGTLGAPGLGLALAGGWFALVLVLGALAAVNRLHPTLDVDRLALIGAHGAVAGLGWIGGTILAVALRLAPMFALSHGYGRRSGTAGLVVWHAAVPLVAAGLLTGTDALAAAGGVALLAAVALSGRYTLGVLAGRRRRVEAPMVHLLTGLLSVAVADLLMLMAAAGMVATPRAATAAGVLVLVGLGCGVTAGHLFKVLPMLVWTGRFAHLAGTPGAPRLSDMYPRRLAVAEQAAFLAGLVLLTVGALAASVPAAVAGAALLAVAAVAVAAAAVACVTRRVPAVPTGAPSPATASPENLTTEGVA